MTRRNLDQRLSALEQQHAPDELPVDVFVVAADPDGTVDRGAKVFSTIKGRWMSVGEAFDDPDTEVITLVGGTTNHEESVDAD